MSYLLEPYDRLAKRIFRSGSRISAQPLSSTWITAVVKYLDAEETK